MRLTAYVLLALLILLAWAIWSSPAPVLEPSEPGWHVVPGSNP